MAALLRARVTRSFASSRVAPSSRRGTVARANDDSTPVAQNGAVFYGGRSYTEEEWQQAVASGKFQTASPAAAPVAAVAPSFADVMAFGGAVPEVANGRLAMLGFVAAMFAEFASGESVLKQWSEEPTGIAITFILFIAASLAPALQGKKPESFGPFSPNAEMINGRAAMIGFAAMLALELSRGQPLF